MVEIYDIIQRYNMTLDSLGKETKRTQRISVCQYSYVTVTRKE